MLVWIRTSNALPCQEEVNNQQPPGTWLQNPFQKHHHPNTAVAHRQGWRWQFYLRYQSPFYPTQSCQGMLRPVWLRKTQSRSTASSKLFSLIALTSGYVLHDSLTFFFCPFCPWIASPKAATLALLRWYWSRQQLWMRWKNQAFGHFCNHSKSSRGFCKTRCVSPGSVPALLIILQPGKRRKKKKPQIKTTNPKTLLLQFWLLTLFFQSCCTGMIFRSGQGGLSQC